MGLCVPNEYTYNCLLEAISRSNSSLVDLVETRLTATLGSVRERKVSVGSIQNFVGENLFGNDEFDGESEIIQILKDHNKASLPDLDCLSSVINCLVKANEVDNAVRWYNDIMIKALCKARRATEADSLFNEMVSKGLKPSVATYNSMVDGWCKEGEIDLAMSCVARMYEDEKDPDVVTYTSLIHGLCASGRPGEAVSRWNEMKGRGCCPNEITFMALIQGLCKCGWTSEALVYFREMEAKEMEPDSGVYVSLVSSFLLSGNISEGFGIFREMVCKGRFPVLVDRNYMVAVDAADKSFC
ncbi:unnamed protein product [Brassica oleracea]|uniref:Pentacotripeptide-repeat region of PRORP domain-containing protein n=1 Tax=Brassica oleracea var. oleracea TaxID=109376 RepID=A0A0D3AI67_BRAOL